MTETEQLAALARIAELRRDHGIEYWLFGGWAIDFHAGAVTRAHHDLELAVWLKDHARIAALLKAEGWEHAPETGEDGYTAYERGRFGRRISYKSPCPAPVREEDQHWLEEVLAKQAPPVQK